jgi:hypothetical protein
MDKGIGVGIELLIQLSPRPTPFSDREDDASRVGLGIFKNYSLIRSLGLVARPVQSKSEVEMRLQSRFCLSTDLNLSPFKYFRPASPALFLSSVSVQTTKQLRSQMPPRSVN